MCTCFCIPLVAINFYFSSFFTNHCYIDGTLNFYWYSNYFHYCPTRLISEIWAAHFITVTISYLRELVTILYTWLEMFPCLKIGFWTREDSMLDTCYTTIFLLQLHSLMCRFCLTIIINITSELVYKLLEPRLWLSLFLLRKFYDILNANLSSLKHKSAADHQIKSEWFSSQYKTTHEFSLHSC